jgi:ATP-dependent exoDNAse (exonuclease V) beta subunit
MIVKPQVASERGTLTLPPTAAGLLRAALADRPDAPPATKLFELGDPGWSASSGTSRVEASEVLPEPPLSPPLRVELAPMPQGRTRGRETVAPSGSKRAARISGRRLLTADRAAVDRGTLWHAWCQQIEWLEDGPIDVDRLSRLGRRLCADEPVLESALSGFLEALNRPAIRGVLSRARYQSESFELPQPLRAELRGAPLEAQCQAERRFTVLDAGRHLSGSIDRLVLLRSGGRVVAAEVIDFKTDAAGEKSANRASYEEQLRLYARAVSIAHRLALPRICGTLVWLATGAVDRLADRAGPAKPRAS